MDLPACNRVEVGLSLLITEAKVKFSGQFIIIEKYLKIIVILRRMYFVAQCYQLNQLLIVVVVVVVVRYFCEITINLQYLIHVYLVNNKKNHNINQSR